MNAKTTTRWAGIPIALLLIAAVSWAAHTSSSEARVPLHVDPADPVVGQETPILPPHPIQPVFLPEVTSEGVTLTTYGGGTVNDLAFELSIRFNDAARAFVTVDGEFLALIPDAPSFVNAPFEDSFAAGIPAGTPMLIVVDPYPSQFQEDLDAARAAWATAGGDDYDMRMRVSCFCLFDPDLTPVNFEVRDGVIVRATNEAGAVVDEVPAFYLTVEGIFDRIQGAIDSRAASISASYDPSGYPLDVFIDQVFLMADEEIGYTIESLTLR